MALFGKRQQQKEDELPAEDSASELDDLRRLIQGAAMPAAIEQIANREVEKLARTSPAATEYTIGVNYLQYLASLPWNTMTEDNLDIKRAKKILDEEHYGLVSVKDRILEYLAVRIMKLSCSNKILVVDDDQVARSNLCHVLAREGYRVTAAASGAEAVALLDKELFDVVVTDLKMTGVDGMVVLDRAKAKDASIEVIMVSGYATTPTTVEAIKRGSFHFLAKPLQLDELRQTIRTALEKKRTRLGSKGPVLCFVGPPGTGKTSLQMSIARCLGRKFIRISLAGMKDEAEIRGHRRTYVGALPGRIIQEIRRAGSRNPLIMLDEIDKIGQDVKGDPASALLEVLDHSQHAHFIDNYLDVPFDLSRVMFIATANTTDPIPPPLLDRLELLHLSGYTEEEKEQIAFRFLIPREIEEAGLGEQPPQFTPEVVRKLIREYTREAGLRGLERQIAAVCRKRAHEILKNPGEKVPAAVTTEKVEEYLGPRKYHFELAGSRERVGVATGLALTAAGGQLIFIEASIMSGHENLIMTGSLGEVMKESAQAALSYIRSNAAQFHIPADFFDRHDIHIHIPAGAVPKDGPSAGLPIALALISLLSRRPVRREVALTGELTLSGRLLPVGGMQDKLLAARRAGIRTVIIPGGNEADLKDIPADVMKDLSIVPAYEVEQIVEVVLAS
jgi:ATP-dependent Lon protease